MLSVNRLRRRSSAVLSCLALAAWPLGASAQVNETEPNDTLGASQMIAIGGGDFSIDGGRTFADPSDDFYSFLVRGPGLLRIVASSPDAGADSVMGLFDSAGNLLASSDDGAGGMMSAIEYTVSAAQLGSFSIGFSGYNPGLLSCTGAVTACYDTDGDFVFDTFVAGGGAGGSTGWDYTLSMSGVALVPEPETALLILPGLALLLAARKRRRG